MPAIVLLNSSNSIVYSLDKTNWNTTATGITGATDMEVAWPFISNATLYVSAKNTATYAYSTNLTTWNSQTITQSSVNFSQNGLVRVNNVVHTIPAVTSAVSVRLNNGSWTNNTGIHWATMTHSASAKSDQFIVFPATSSAYLDMLMVSNNITQNGCVTGAWASSCWLGSASAAFLAASNTSGAIQKGTGQTLSTAGSWTSVTSTTFTGGHHSIISNGAGMAMAFPKTAGNIYALTTNAGATWDYYTLPATVTLEFAKGDQTGFTLVPSGTTSFILHSDDGYTWETITVPSAVYKSVVIMAGNYTANLTTTSVSTAFAPWTFLRTVSTIVSNATEKSVSVLVRRLVNSSVLPTINLRRFWSFPWSIVYAATKWIGVKKDTNVSATSTDGITWSTSTLPVNDLWTSLAYGTTTAIAIAGKSNKAATTTDGVTWTDKTLPTSRLWKSIAANGSTFTAVAIDSDQAVTSVNNGATWTEYSLPKIDNWTSVTYGNGLFVAVCDGGIAATSPNGITWTSRSMPDALRFNSVTWANNQFTAVASGPTNLAATSLDGITWTRIYMPSAQNWTAVGPGVGNPNV